MTRHGRGADAGSGAVELMMAAPVLLAAALLMVLAGRYTGAAMAVESVAHTAARAASLQDTATGAAASATGAADAALAERGLSCQDHDVRLELNGMRRGTTVAAEVVCTVSLSDLAPLDLPGSTVISARSHSPVDVHQDEEQR